jgi:hypothetical protein
MHDAFPVVGQYLETHFGTHSSKRPGQDVGGTHPVQERTEYMLNGTSADSHYIWFPVESTLHGFQYMFVLPSSDAAIVAGRTSLLEMETRVGAGPVHPQIHVMLNGLPDGKAGMSVESRKLPLTSRGSQGPLRVASTHPTAARIDIRSRAGMNGKRATLSGLTNGDP